MIKKIYISLILKKIIRPIITLFYQYSLPSKYHNTKNYDEDFYPVEIFKKEQSIKSYNHFKKYFSEAILINDKLGTLISRERSSEKIREFSIKKSLLNDINSEKLYLEFGVYKGKSINFLSNFLNTKIYGFDSFEGLREDWMGSKNSAGSMNLDGDLPKVNSNVEIIKGDVEDTLNDFLNNNKNKKIIFMHMDLDVYSSTKFVLQKVKPYLDKKCVILFDELYNHPGWEHGEYKALTEVFNENEYRYLAFTNFEKVAIQIN
tara:strand:- start:55 stop:837 length:783 start_codon:yes stop_codon:yes gene_type:complete